MTPHGRRYLLPGGMRFAVCAVALWIGGLVFSSHAASGRWRYAEVPGYEVLSQCSDALTEHCVQSIENGFWMQRQLFLVDGFYAKVSTPRLIIIFDESSADGPVIEPMKMIGHNLSGHIERTDFDIIAEGLNLWHILDLDAFYKFHFFYSNAEHGKFYLDHCTPELPPWLIEGLVGKYGVYRHWPVFGNYIASYEITTEPLRLKSSFHELLPLQEFFGQPLADNYSEQWLEQAGLFAYWTITADKGKYSQAFWAFGQSCRSEPASEERFKALFGLSYVQAEKKLQQYISTAKNIPITQREEGLPPTWGAGFSLTLRDATDAEIARIRGDWERLYGKSLEFGKDADPAKSKAYIDHAGQLLTQAYQRGERDPRLLVVLGLYYIDSGQKEKAGEFLAQAVAAHVPRPRAYIKLAELRLSAACAKGKPLTDDQLAGVLEPLFAVRDLAPDYPETYDLIAAAWRQAATKPDRKNLAVLDEEGMKLFPRDTELAYATAKLYAKNGFAQDAARCAEQGMKFVTDEATKARFAEFKSSLSVSRP